MKTTIFYIYDALCGWCYGFSPVMQDFYEQHKDSFEFTVLSGGMVLGEREGPVGQIAAFLKEAHKNVESLSGVSFGEAFLNDTLEKGTAHFSSKMPSLALTALKDLAPGRSIEQASALQKMVYWYGKSPSVIESYKDVAAQFDVPFNALKASMESDKINQRTEQEFKVVKNWGINGFPTVVLLQGEQGYMLSRGFTSIDNLNETLNRVIEEIKD